MVLAKPILFGDNIFETFANFCWFFVPASIFISALIQKQIFLRMTYLLGTVPLVLNASVINKIGYKSLYVLKVVLLITVVVCLMKYLVNTTELYKKALKQKEGTDNQASAPGGSQSHHSWAEALKT